MAANPLDYYTEAEWKQFHDEATKHESPCIIINLDIIKKNYIRMKELYPKIKIYYAIKTNPCEEVIKVLRDLGSCFDVATVYEIDLALSLGISPDRLSYGNTIKKAKDIDYAYKKGIRLIATDSIVDVDNIVKYAPEAKVFFRLQTITGNTADHPLSRKFGAQPDLLMRLLEYAYKKGVHIAGVSFHVGSQQRDIGAWDTALCQVHHIYNHFHKKHPDVHFEIVNIGGGFPATYVNHAPPDENYASEINHYLDRVFKDTPHGTPEPIYMMEPGRGIAGDAGVLVTDVVLTEQKHKHSIDSWLYIDTGRFGGLTETYNEAIRYPVATERKGPVTTNYIVAGPTCDSMDIIYEKYRVPLPMGMEQGDRMYFLSAGAYTHSTCSIGFNGFPPPKVYFVGIGK